MDYSATNIQLWSFVIQMGIIAVCIMFANLLRNNIPAIKKSLMPVAVIAGFFMLFLKLLNIVKIDVNIMEELVYHCIALGFIAMSLRVPVEKTERKGDRVGLKSGALIVGTYLVQAVFGLIVTILLSYTIKPGFFKAAGVLLCMGYGQGPGQANNIGGTYEALGFVGGRSFGLALAAAGYLCACIVGVIILNMLRKRGKLSCLNSKADDDLTVGFFQDKNEIPVSDSIDKLSIQICMVLVVYLVTYLATRVITAGIGALSEGLADTLNTLLWGFNFIIGAGVAMLTRSVLEWGKKKKLIVRQYQNNYLLNRISGFFFDIMIVAGIASINPEDLSGQWFPFAILAIGGGIFTWIWLAYICKKIYADYYYEGLISMYGMMTGTIGSGILLLREIDPQFNTPAANNLVSGSSFAIILGIPMLILVGLAPKSTTLCFVTLLLAALYWLLLFLLILKLKNKKIKK
ncbi:MAG: hypothetical protein Q4E35_00445 [Eubacteriales bacterium]|nr:hypothetical protein [Eubacteriales bacterium]